MCPCLAWLAQTGKDVLKFRFVFFLKRLGKINNKVIISFLKQGRETGTSQSWIGYWEEKKISNVVSSSTKANEVS